MPKVTVWIKEDDLEKFLAIENRPAWLHSKINEDEYVKLVDADGSFRTIGPITSSGFVPTNKNVKVNKDGTISPIDPNKPSRFTTVKAIEKTDE